MKNNPRVTPKEKNLIKAAVRRVFSRSELRRAIIDAGVIEHTDLSRPKVKTWIFCQECGVIDAKSYFQVDHIEPVVPIHQTLFDLSADELIDRIWCLSNNLQRLCLDCHKAKSKLEAKQRRALKKGKK